MDRHQVVSSATLRRRRSLTKWGFVAAAPLGEFLRGYVQLFSGYGDTLIDYNFRKNSIGLGISIGSWY